MDGLLSFFGSYHALRADMVLRRQGFVCKLVPGPKELSPNCGVAVRFELAQRVRVIITLAEHKVQFEAIHPYTPRTDAWRSQ